eukprot:CAMPEP_0172377752 /NCGR_PEP_ID=MMETSP1060-20121228/69070_1 /TAXON_ID=37318 /ORGANISM="Pseudo-nitzschia pungens, Strain cf. cingulata" /LENGTH=1157 /DNA_ID=CAMNT_0013105461 /DNA_START=1692 /DNA_END=5165 /DNA_ORIENTATION=+
MSSIGGDDNDKDNDDDDDYCSSIHKFVARQRELLDLELQAENNDESAIGSKKDNKSRSNNSSSREDHEQRRSHVLGRLEASDVSVGLYGRTVVRLTRWTSSETGGTANEPIPRTSSDGLPLLPAHRFAVGNEVEIRTKASGSGSSGSGSRSQKGTLGGVVSAVSDTSVSVAIIFKDAKHSSAQANKGKPKNSSAKKKASSGAAGDEDDEMSLLDSAPLTLVPKSSIEVHKKLVAALERLERHGEDHPIAGSVVRALFSAPGSRSHSHPQPQSRPSSPAKPCFNPGLDASQRDAIAFALQPDRRVALIHGPPGTGKTTTVAELIRQAVHRHGMRVLVTAPSNVAVDNILERLTGDEDQSRGKASSKQKSLRTVRLGHPARIKPSIIKHSLEALVQSSDGTEVVRDVRNELESYLKVISRSARSDAAAKNRKGQRTKVDKQAAYKEIKSLRKEVRVREEKVVQDLIRSAHVVLATTVGADNRVLNQITHPKEGNGGDKNKGFDLVIIDEAAQALEASCWIPILRGRKVVLAGDHCQLPPTIKSKDSRVVAGLGVTLFERLMRLYRSREHDISRMLQIQYRMHHKIADWASQAMYHGELSTHDSVKTRTLGQLDSVRARKEESDRSGGSTVEDEDEEDGFGHLSDTTLLMIDTSGCDMHEQETEAGSRFNEGEASLVSQHVRNLLDLGVEQNQVAIITPYNGQVELLRNLLLPEFPRLEIRSVDGFQGGEREAVVLSLVRSSEKGGRDGIGFLRDDRRQNVAVTRAKRHLALICDSETVSQSSFVRNLIEWIETHGDQRSAIEYVYASESEDNHREYEDDLVASELELQKLIERSSATSGNDSSEKSPIQRSSNKKESPPKRPNATSLNESERKELMGRIQNFVETGKKGDEMALSSELSSADRRLIHEFAEKEGLGHRSEGTEGVDRRIVLVIEKQAASNDDTTELPSELRDTTRASKDSESPKEETPDTELSTKVVSNFATLSMDDSDSDEGETGEDTPKKTEAIEQESSVNLQTDNSLLAQLAKERASRQQQQRKQHQQAQSKAPAASTKKKKKKKPNKSKGQRLGGGIPPKKAPPKEDLGLDDLDDMAFLDAQIEKAQNTHGRKVQGSGKQYRTIVNGILNSRPEPKAKPKNSNASDALRSKLNEAGKARRKKTKK